MPGRPRKPASKRPAVAESLVDPTAGVMNPRRRTAPPALLEARSGASVAERNLAKDPVTLSRSYNAALGMEVGDHEAEDADAFRTAILRQLKGWRGGKGIKVSDAIAAGLMARVVNLTARDGVLAAREIADRTEGPVVQRTASASVSYVVSVTPAGTVGSGAMQPQSLSEWEAKALSDWRDAQPVPDPLDEAQVRIPQVITGSSR